MTSKDQELRDIGRSLLLQGAFSAPSVLAQDDYERSMRYLRKLHTRVKNDSRGRIVSRAMRRLKDLETSSTTLKSVARRKLRA